MKHFIRLIICASLILLLSGCSNSKGNIDSSQAEVTNDALESTVNEPDTSAITKETSAEDVTAEEEEEIAAKEAIIEAEEKTMKLFINDIEIPVTWENNDSVNEIAKEVSEAEIIVEMSMYSDNEQVGPLGRAFASNDKQTTTHNGDIVLYNSRNIVVFYGSNSWAYTRLGKMELPEQEVTDLLANGDMVIRIAR